MRSRCGGRNVADNSKKHPYSKLFEKDGIGHFLGSEHIAAHNAALPPDAPRTQLPDLDLFVPDRPRYPIRPSLFAAVRHRPPSLWAIGKASPRNLGWPQYTTRRTAAAVLFDWAYCNKAWTIARRARVKQRVISLGVTCHVASSQRSQR